MGTLALAIVVAVIAVGGLLALLVRRHVAQADRRDFAGGGSATVASDPGSGNAGDSCGDPGTGGDCGGDGGGGGGD